MEFVVSIIRGKIIAVDSRDIDSNIIGCQEWVINIQSSRKDFLLVL